MKQALLEVYSDYLIISSSQTTATGLSKVLDNKTSHDSFTRFLSSGDFSQKDQWMLGIPWCGRMNPIERLLIVDDTVLEKPHSRENEMICWHFDHTKNRNVKGINLVSLLCFSKGVSIPVSSEIIKKTETRIDKKTGVEKRRSPVTKNEIFRKFLGRARNNEIRFKYVLSERWYASQENMIRIKIDLEKDFIMAIKSNRTAALSEEDKHQGKFVGIDSL